MLHKRKNVEKLEKFEQGEKSKRPKWKYYLVLALALVLLTFALGRAGAFEKQEGMCLPAENSIYEYIGSGVFTHKQSGIEVQVVRAVKNASFSVQGDRDISLPPCFSKDKDLDSIYNLSLINKKNGDEIFIISGVIVHNEELLDFLIRVPQNQEVIPEAETPLP